MTDQQPTSVASPAKRPASAANDSAEDPAAKKQSTSALDELKKITKVVADTGDYEAIKTFQPVDATTNPSLILQVAKNPAYESVVEEAVCAARKATDNSSDPDVLIPEICDQLLTTFGGKILEIVPGVVSIEVDASLSFDKKGSIERAKRIVELFKAKGIDHGRLLIKLAATWEGCQAAKELQAEGINCNLTLIFSLYQAIAAAEAKSFLISPFVGRILDWYKAAEGKDSYESSQDPGVISVREIYYYFKKHGYQTVVMGASFRNVGEILELAGCDNLTVSPKLLKELSDLPAAELQQKLKSTDADKLCTMDKINLTEEKFRWEMNASKMACDKLAEGIRGFDADWNKLKLHLKQKYMTPA